MRVVARLECGKIPPSCPRFEQALDGSGNFHVAADCRMSLREYGCWWRIAEKEFTQVWQSIAYYGGLLVESALGVFGIRLYEEPRYDVIDRIGDRVEIRRYVPRLAAEVDLTSAGDAGRREAFQLLFAYIAGANRASAIGQSTIAMTTPVEVSGNELVAMTVPVETSDNAAAGHMRFFLPLKYTLDTAPHPLNPRVRLVTVSEQTIAAFRFSGSTSDIVERKAELMRRLVNAKWRPDGVPYALFYDAPFTLSFLRRNEAAVAVGRLTLGLDPGTARF